MDNHRSVLSGLSENVTGTLMTIYSRVFPGETNLRQTALR